VIRRDFVRASYWLQEAAVHCRLAEMAAISGDDEKTERELAVMESQFKKAATSLGLAFLEQKEVLPA
jgi:hypothetical protein